jgi:alkanesulfonate monooxygenase SsuD/methylene tetrahydromethanopterin reductase-like flavin-dependent oxidoreductase (luciferase family)
MGDPYEEHGARTDEAIAIMRALWTQAMPSHQGAFISFRAWPFLPNPGRSPTSPG